MPCAIVFMSPGRAEQKKEGRRTGEHLKHLVHSRAREAAAAPQRGAPRMAWWRRPASAWRRASAKMSLSCAMRASRPQNTSRCAL